MSNPKDLTPLGRILLSPDALKLKQQPRGQGVRGASKDFQQKLNKIRKKQKMNKPKYTPAFILKIVQCAKCNAMLGSDKIDLFINPDEMVIQAEKAPIVHKLDCASGADIIVIYDTAFVPVAILDPVILGGNSGGNPKLS